MRHILLVLVLLVASSARAGDDADLTRLETGDDARGWEAVGRLDIEGKGFCTGTLIAPDLVLTAAHCLFERDSGDLIAPERFQFLAGLRNGRAEAYRDVRRAVPHPLYTHDGTARADVSRWDIALIELSQPIGPAEVAPLAVAETAGIGTEVGVVSYAFDRSEAPALQQLCGLIGSEEGILVFSCDVDFGSSGAPVFRMVDGRAEVVSVVSAKAELDGARVAVGMDLTQPLTDLRAALADTSFAAVPPGDVRVIRPGERAETGAHFVTAGD